MRTFIAIEIPEGIKQEMARAQATLRASGVDAGWTRPEGIHLTLKFLGEVAESRVQEILAALEQAAAGTGPLRLSVNGAGVFPSANNPRVAWLGVTGETEKLSALQARVVDAMERLGFAREDRPFRPHLTLARIKYVRSRRKWEEALDGIRNIRLPEFSADRVSLMKSELKPSGAVYTEVAAVPLEG